MRRFKIAVVFVPGVIAFAGPAKFQQEPAVARMQQPLTQSTYMAYVTSSPSIALEQWFSQPTVRTIPVFQRSLPHVSSLARSAMYTGTGGGHRIKSKADSGAVISLEDGSMWEISSFDRFTTVLWLPVTDITILQTDSPKGAYRYVLVNMDS